MSRRIRIKRTEKLSADYLNGYRTAKNEAAGKVMVLEHEISTHEATVAGLRQNIDTQINVIKGLRERVDYLIKKAGVAESQLESMAPRMKYLETCIIGLEATLKRLRAAPAAYNKLLKMQESHNLEIPGFLPHPDEFIAYILSGVEDMIDAYHHKKRQTDPVENDENDEDEEDDRFYEPPF